MEKRKGELGLDKTFLDLKRLSRFREAVNKTEIFYHSSEEKHNWNLICAVMDRLGSAAEFLNRSDIKTEEDLICFFVFTDIIYSCITELFKTLHLDYKLKDDSSCFNKTDLEGSAVSDDLFMKYIRSLSYAHSLGAREGRKFIKKGETQYSPWVICNYPFEKGVVGVRLYSSVTGDSWDGLRDILFSLSDLRKYVKMRFDQISLARIEIEKRVQRQKEAWGKRKINREGTTTDVLNDISLVLKERYEDGPCLLLDDAIDVFSIRSSDPRNDRVIEKYRRYIASTIPQVCDMVDAVNEDALNDCEFCKAVTPDIPEIYNGIGYQLEKIYSYLTDDEAHGQKFRKEMLESGPQTDSDLAWGFVQLSHFKERFSDKYVQIDYSMPYPEIRLLVKVAIFLYNCEKKKTNEDVPN
jgi:hypothetical protein